MYVPSICTTQSGFGVRRTRQNYHFFNLYAIFQYIFWTVESASKYISSDYNLAFKTYA